MLKIAFNCDAVKIQIVLRFWVAWRDFAGRMYGFCWRQNRGAIVCSVTRFLDKVVVPWVIHNNRGAIFKGAARFCLSLCTI